MAEATPEAQITEVGPESTSRTYAVFCALRQGRPVMATRETFTSWINERQRPQGYRIVAAFLPDCEDALCAAGFRVEWTLSRGLMLYVDDLVTLPEYRGKGYADRVFAWLVEEARRQGCEQLHLDSGHSRHEAHRFYLRHGMVINAHHFSMVVR